MQIRSSLRPEPPSLPGGRRAVVALAALTVVMLSVAHRGVDALAAQGFTVSLSCSPNAVEAGEEVTCTALALFDGEREPLSYHWTPTGEGGANASSRVFHFNSGDEGLIDVLVCVTDAEGRQTDRCVRDNARVGVDPAPIEGLSCTPASITDRGTTSCRVTFLAERAELSWTAGPNTLVGSGTGIDFTTGFSRPGTATISVRGCITSDTRPQPRCADLSTTVEVSQGPFPSVRSLRCGPDLLTPGQAVSCTATVENEPNRLVWSAYGGTPSQGAGLSFGTNFMEAGLFTITFIACLDGFGDPRCDQASTTVRVAGNLSPRIRTLNCGPDLVPVNEVVSCSPEVTGSQTSFSWTAGPDAAPAAGNGPRFGVRFSQPGTKTISLHACLIRGEGADRIEICDDLSQPITVTSTAPGIEAVTCTPAAAEAGRPVSCTARTAGATPTSWLWTAAGGMPASGAASSFSTSFASAGSYTVRVQACISDRCASREAAVTVSARGPVSLSGQFTLNQTSGGDCNPTYSPVTQGSISLQITYPENPSEPARVTGSLQGNGSGTITWRCEGLTGSAAWSQTYQVTNFSGTVDRTSGAIISLTGTLTGSRSVRHSNCRRDGRTESCPANDTNSYSFPVRLSGTLRENGGSGTLHVDRISLATSGPWRIP